MIELSLAFAIGLYVLANVILIVVGAVFVSDTARTAMIQSYNDAVEVWPTYYESFKMAEFTAGTGNISANLTRQTSGDVLKDEEKAAFKPYSILYYGANVPPLNGGEYVFYTRKTMSIIARYSASVYPPEVMGAIFPDECDEYIECDDDCKTEKRSCMDACIDYDGIWSNSLETCQVKVYLRKLCILVESTGSGGWSQAQYISTGGYGCYYESSSEIFGESDNSPGVYTTEPGPVAIQVRHVGDPYVHASYITAGAYEFDPTSGKRDIIGKILLGIGGSMLALLAVAGLISGFRSSLRLTNRSKNIALTSSTLNTAVASPIVNTHPQNPSFSQNDRPSAPPLLFSTGARGTSGSATSQRPPPFNPNFYRTFKDEPPPSYLP